jgi:hypothetical protein
VSPFAPSSAEAPSGDLAAHAGAAPPDDLEAVAARARAEALLGEPGSELDAFVRVRAEGGDVRFDDAWYASAWARAYGRAALDEGPSVESADSPLDPEAPPTLAPCGPWAYELFGAEMGRHVLDAGGGRPVRLRVEVWPVDAADVWPTGQREFELLTFGRARGRSCCGQPDPPFVARHRPTGTMVRPPVGSNPHRQRALSPSLLRAIVGADDRDAAPTRRHTVSGRDAIGGPGWRRGLIARRLAWLARRAAGGAT